MKAHGEGMVPNTAALEFGKIRGICTGSMGHMMLDNRSMRILFGRRTLGSAHAPLSHQHSAWLLRLLAVGRGRIQLPHTRVLLQLSHRRATSGQRTTPPGHIRPTGETALASRVCVSIGHERLPRPHGAVPAAELFRRVCRRYLRVSDVPGLRSGIPDSRYHRHGGAAGRDAFVESAADPIGLAVVSSLEEDADDGEQDEADDDDYHHNHPFLPTGQRASWARSSARVHT